MKWLGIVGIVVSTQALAAQVEPIPSGDTEAEIVAAAERQGRAYPRLEAPTDTTPMFATRNGSAARRCTEGIELGPVRSGEFVIGGQLGGSRMMRAGLQGKVWWAPLHHALDMPPLVVRGRNLASPGDTVHYTTPHVAWPVTPGPFPVEESGREHFFPSGISLPTPGRWLVIATSGSNWGCFIISAK